MEANPEKADREKIEFSRKAEKENEKGIEKNRKEWKRMRKNGIG